MIDLNRHRRNVYHKAGIKECPHYSEDGVILEIFRHIGVGPNPLAVEFGEARSLGTTTRSFRIPHRANAVYFTGNLSIESRILNLADVVKTAFDTRDTSFLSFLKSLPFKFFVTPDNVVDLFRRRRVGAIDFLAVDIDSYDYFVVKALLEAGYLPRLLVLEYNPSLPVHRALAFPYGSTEQRPSNKRVYGASYQAMASLAAVYGYALVHISGFCNLFFVGQEHARLFSTPNILAEIPSTDEDVMEFIARYCQEGFIPSWFSEPPLSLADLDYFVEV